LLVSLGRNSFDRYPVPAYLDNMTGSSTAVQSESPRPLGITILGILMIIAGLFNFAGGIGLLMSTDIFVAGISALGVLFGLVYVLTGFGFLQGARWAWTPGFIVSILNLVRTLLEAAQGAVLFALPGIIVALIILYYLTTPAVRGFFDHGNRPPNPDKPVGASIRLLSERCSQKAHSMAANEKPLPESASGRVVCLGYVLRGSRGLALRGLRLFCLLGSLYR
jgi:lysylphosphatidylglycerol synthetase-like protein (DUF2156 family)